MPGTVFSEALSVCPRTWKNKKLIKNALISSNYLLTGGHFITAFRIRLQKKVPTTHTPS